MPKIPDCDGRKANRLRHRCLLCAHDLYIVCAVHPTGSTGNSCFDFRPDPQLEGRRFVDFLGLESQQQDNEPFNNPFDLEPNEDLWEPKGASYYAGELILQPHQRWTPEEQLWLLDHHPLWTSRYPACNRQFPQYNRPPIHWDCECGWIDDSV